MDFLLALLLIMIVIGALVGFDLLAMSAGVDSRPTIDDRSGTWRI